MTDHAIHPGEHLREFLEAQELPQSEAARRLGVSTKHLSQIITGKAGISAEMALALERVVGAGAAMWLNLDAHFRMAKARAADATVREEWVDWAETFPIAELRKRGIVSPPRKGGEMVAQLLSFFGVASKDEWEEVYGSPRAQYRQSPSFVASTKAQVTYLRIAELRAEVWDLSPFDKDRLRKALDQIRGQLTEDPEKLLGRAKEKLARSGVALVLEPGVEKARLSGAAFWPRRDKAVLALTDRFKTADHLWFSFFHEAGHLLLHRDRTVVEVEGATGDLEEEADAFARSVLIAPEAYNDLVAGQTSKEQIARCAEENALPIDSLIGMLQHDGLLPHSAYREIKRPVDFPKPKKPGA